MEESMLIQYLANVLLAAAVDRKIVTAEGEAMERVLFETGATVADLERAAAHVQSGHGLLAVGRFSVRARNLEDMVLVALADGQLPVEEKEAVISFAGQVPVTKEQLRDISKEARDRL